MAESKFIKANEKIAEKVVGGYKAVENGVVGGYNKVEKTVVGGYTKVENAFVDRFLTHDGESVEEAKARLHAEEQARQAQKQYNAHVSGGEHARQGLENTQHVNEAVPHTAKEN